MPRERDVEETTFRRAPELAVSEVSLRPPVLFHYGKSSRTSGILTDQVVRATHLRDMADGQELQYTYNMAREELERLAAAEQPGLRRQFFEAVIADYAQWDENLGAYAFCLSSPPESAPQWHAYADRGNGFCIQFCSDRILPQAVDHRAPEPVFLSVVYDVATQRELVRSAILDTAAHIDKGVNPDRLMGTLFARLSLVALRLKDPSFRTEQEWRIACVLTPEHGRDRTKLHEGTTRRYVPIRIAAEAWPAAGVVRKLLVGPKSDGQLGGAPARDWLDNCGYRDVPTQQSIFFFG